MQTSMTPWILAIKRYRFLAAALFLSIIALTLTVILFYPRGYRSEAKLLLRVGRESVSLDPTASTVGERLYLHQTREHEMQTALGVMHSETLMERVIESVGTDVILSGTVDEGADTSESRPLEWIGQWTASLKQRLSSIDPVPNHERAVRTLSKGISISAPSESSVVSVEYLTKSPEVAQAVIDAWLENYISLHATVNRTQGTYAFFAEQDKSLKQTLEDARRALRDRKSDAMLVTIEGQQQLLEQELATVRTGLIEVEGESAAAQSRIEEFTTILASAVDPNITEEVTGKANESRDEMRGQLFELETLEKDLMSKLQPEHPKLTAVRRQLSELREIVGDESTDRKEVTRRVNPAYQRMLEEQLLQRATSQALKNQRTTLLTKQQELLREVAQLNDNEQNIRALSNEVEILENRYALHSEKLEQARLDEVLEEQRITSVNIVQPATLQYRPTTPNKTLCGILGLFAAIFAALGVPLLLQCWDEPLTYAGGDRLNVRAAQAMGSPSRGNSPAPSEVVHEHDEAAAIGSPAHDVHSDEEDAAVRLSPR
jgi:uncharacterized protein involved in exopolysaccharide biosynthesis